MNGTDWIMTFTGKHFYPYSPIVEDIDIQDIAHALSQICRFGGHCSRFYSVAEHSILVSIRCPQELKLVGLLHDAAEAYLGDVPTPLKQEWFQKTEHNLMMAIYKRFDLRRFRADQSSIDLIKKIDSHLLLIEASALDMRPEEWVVLPDTDWKDIKDCAILVQGIEPNRVEQLFLAHFQMLTNPHP
jgi:hypothetical protein